MEDSIRPSREPPQSYSSRQMQKDWCYGGFEVSPEIRYNETLAPEDLSYYESQAYKLDLPGETGPSSLNADETLLAVASGNNIHIFNLSPFKLKRVLKGHGTVVSSLIFHPKLPFQLYSASEEDRYGDSMEIPTIIAWQLDAGAEGEAESERYIDQLADQTTDAIVEALNCVPTGFNISVEDRKDLARDVTKILAKLNARQLVRMQITISGRLCTSFQGKLFNSSGSKLIYLPDSQPQSNSVAQWDISIWDTKAQQDLFTLQGHTDAIMWTGFSPDDKLIGSVSWDRSFKIWSAANGACLHTFHTQGQNWTGGFSPDSRFFAGTSGDGFLWVYDVNIGTKIVSYNFGEGKSHGTWGRALDWKPTIIADKYVLALGSCGGHLSIFEFDDHALSLQRSFVLSLDAAPEHLHRIMPTFLETSTVRFLSETKLIWNCPTDQGVQLYDMNKDRLWRMHSVNEDDIGEFQEWPALLLGSKGLIATLAGQDLNLLQEDPSVDSGAGWTTHAGILRQPSAHSAPEIFINY